MFVLPKGRMEGHVTWHYGRLSMTDLGFIDQMHKIHDIVSTFPTKLSISPRSLIIGQPYRHVMSRDPSMLWGTLHKNKKQKNQKNEKHDDSSGCYFIQYKYMEINGDHWLIWDCCCCCCCCCCYSSKVVGDFGIGIQPVVVTNCSGSNASLLWLPYNCIYFSYSSIMLCSESYICCKVFFYILPCTNLYLRNYVSMLALFTNIIFPFQY